MIKIKVALQWFTSTAILILLIGCHFTLSEDTESVLPDKVDFNFHVKPILSDRCFKCHGPDENARKANLRLDLEKTAFAPLDSTDQQYAIVPGSVKKSELIHRITSQDPDYMMPPPESNLKLADHEIALLKKWIAQGAEWKPHWAFIPPEPPELPDVRSSSWVQNPVDQFILARLEKEGLRPSAEASKEKLIRRLSFDLRGLPPELDEIDAFLADTSPEAYEKVVDRLLTEPSYGERMAMDWMDLARYADSHGYQDDLERSMWPWRDWVIRAFNANMPYDQFVSWQLAGDLLPDATYEQKLATAFNRNHKITQEVGVIDEEYRVTYVLDRVNTFSTAFLGLTVECAQCHDHKFDPISQKEYYGLFSFFNNVPEKGRVDYGVEVAAPFLALPEEKVEALRKYIGDLLSSQQLKRERYAEAKWKNLRDPESAERSTAKSSLTFPPGLRAWYPLDYIEHDQLSDLVEGKKATTYNDLIPVPGRFSGGLEFMGDNYASLPTYRELDFASAFTLSFWIRSLDGGIRGAVLAAADQQEHVNTVLQVTNDKTLELQVYNPGNETRLRLLSRETLPENQWVQIGLSHDGSRRAAGIKWYMDGKLLKHPYVLNDNLRGRLPASKKLYLGTKNPIIPHQGSATDEKAFFSGQAKGLVAGQLDELMLFDRALSPAELQQLVSYRPLSALLSRKEKSQADLKRLFYHQLLHEDTEYQAITQRLREYKIRAGRTEDIVVKPTMVMADMDTLRPTFVLDRGRYDAPTVRVEAGTPQAILPMEKDLPKNRAGLAQWLFDDRNPLTARVAVNHYWQMIFGRGLVSTPEDFGSQGDLPTHPALLDWLALEFRNSGWDVKALIKTMVMSATYRQSVRTNENLQRTDPGNILLSRGSQTRLPAEMIRDQALALSGLLSDRIGGPSVKPYQPEGLWLQVASGNQSLRKYIQEHDEDLYRRSLYTFWKRTVPPPSMIIFDAPSREQCTIRRRPTNTPMQALLLLNDPQFVEASRLMAVRMMTEGGVSTKDRIVFGFRLATSRRPDARELKVLSNLLDQEMISFRNDPAAAEKLLRIGEYPPAPEFEPSELAAYTIISNTILNLTETLRKG